MINFNETINHFLEQNHVEFIDFGASKGGSIEFAKKYFSTHKKGNGIGLDIDEEKLSAMRESGFDCFFADITKLDLKHKVRFVTMLHFLEHLTGFSDMRKAIHSAVKNTTDFVYIHQPYFDADGYLMQHGLKLYWSHWSGHTNHATSLQFRNILDQLKSSKFIHRFAIYGYDRILDSQNSCVLPLSSTQNQHHYRADEHDQKPAVVFNPTVKVFREIRILIGKSEKTQFDSLERKFQWDEKLFDSDTTLSDQTKNMEKTALVAV